MRESEILKGNAFFRLDRCAILENPDNADADSGDANLDHERGEHMTEDGGDVRHGSVSMIS